MRNKIGVSFLFACWIAAVSTAMAQGNTPDLIPVVIDAGQGVVEIRNIGDVATKSSRVFVICSRFAPNSKHTESCAAGLHLLGFIEKWNTLPYDVPALRPGASYRFQVFGPGAFQRRPGTYSMKIIADPQKHIAEGDEKNNFVRLDTFIKAEPGILRLVAQAASGRPVLPAHYVVRRHGEDAKSSMPMAFGDIQDLPVDVRLAPGAYDVRVTQQRTFLNPTIRPVRNVQQILDQRILGKIELASLSNVHIGSEKIVDAPINFKRRVPGKLILHVVADGNPARAYVGIGIPGGGAVPILESYPAFLGPSTKMSLLPGQYVLSVEPEDDGGRLQGHGYGKRKIGIDIRSGLATERTLVFTSVEKGRLVLTALVNGSRSKAEISVRRAGSSESFGTIIATYNLFTNAAELLPGRYDISIRPLEAVISLGGVDVFHGHLQGPGIETHRIRGIEPIILHGIEIEPGEALKKTVSFEKKQGRETK